MINRFYLRVDQFFARASISSIGGNVMQMSSFVKITLVAVALVWAPSVAAAADVKGPPIRQPPPVPYYDWSGFYLGAHAGFGWGKDSDVLDTGFVGGGQVGFNHQVGHWVFGVEGTFSGTSIGQSFNNVDVNVDWISTLAFRAGWAFDRWLVYGKVGGAWANINISENGGGGSENDTVSGLLLGVGTEYALQNNWTLKFEYNYMDLDNAFEEIDGRIHVFKAGVNYRFGYGLGYGYAADRPVRSASSPPPRQSAPTVYSGPGGY